MARVIYRGPNIHGVIQAIVHSFLPEAGKRIRNRAVGKLGHYQPGWAPLAQSTLDRKSRRKRKGSRSIKYMSLGQGDDPLVDTGRMAMSLRYRAQGKSAIVDAAFPAGIHEQDPLMDARGFDLGGVGSHTPPRRAFLGPALDEEMGPLTSDLETFVAIRF